MKPPNNSPRLSAEMMAAADALRNISQHVERLERAGHTAVAGSAEAAVIACNAPPVVEALDSLAQRLAIQE